MRVIGYRKNSIAVLYFLTLFLGLIVSGAAMRDLIGVMLLFGIVIILASVIVLIGFFRTPYEAVKVIDGRTVALKKVSFEIREIHDVSYRCASARGHRYKWGKVIIETYSETYKVNYIDDCEHATKELLKLVYEAKAAEQRE